MQLSAAYVVHPGDRAYGVKFLTQDWLGEGTITNVLEPPGDLLWSSFNEPKQAQMDGVDWENPVYAGYRFAIGQVRMLPDGRVFFVTPADDVKWVTLRAAFDLAPHNVGHQFRYSPIVYDPRIDDSVAQAERCRSAWVRLLRNAPK